MKPVITILFLHFNILCFSQHIDTLDNDTISIVLCDEREMAYLFEYNILDTLCICNNEEAVEIYQRMLNRLKLFDDSKEGKMLNEISNIVLNLVFLTDIDSESDGNYIGRLPPTKKDIGRWEEWFDSHKDLVCWYPEKRILFMRKH